MKKITWIINVVFSLVRTKLDSTLSMLRLLLAGVRVGRALNVNGWLKLSIHPTSNFSLGDQVRINSGFARNAVGGYRRTGIYVGRNSELRIGNNVGMSNCTLVCTNSIVIEDNVMVGGGTNIYDTDFHAIDPALRRSGVGGATAPIVIEKNAFIGGHVTILKGVTIGMNSVVGAGSIVTKNVPPNEIWAGNPARRIRSLID